MSSFILGFSIVKQVVGEAWASVLAEKVRLCGKSRCRLNIPYYSCERERQRFYDFVGDKHIADKLMQELGGQRPHMISSGSKLIQRARKQLINLGYSSSELAQIIRADVEIYGYQHKEATEDQECNKEATEDQLKLGLN